MFAMTIEDMKMKMVEREGLKKKKKKSTEGCMLSVVYILYLQNVLDFNCEGVWWVTLSEDMFRLETKS